MKTKFLFALVLSALLLSAEAFAYPTVIARGPTRSGFVVEGIVNCYQAYTEFFELSGGNELFGQREDVYSFPVGITCRHDDEYTYVLAYVKFVPVTEKGWQMVQNVIETRTGLNFYDNPITFEIPTEMVVETKVVISRDNKEPIELRKAELLKNEKEAEIGEAFSKEVREVSADLDAFENLLTSEFGEVSNEFQMALKEARSIKVRKTMMYIFNSSYLRTLDWSWQFWGADRTCGDGECPYPYSPLPIK